MERPGWWCHAPNRVHPFFDMSLTLQIPQAHLWQSPRRGRATRTAATARGYLLDPGENEISRTNTLSR